VTEADTGDDTAEVCGESFDHDLRLIDEPDGYATYECRTCGAEVFTEPDDAEEGQ
jgi:hypothetical protein